MCLLHGGNIVVASSFDDKVKMFDTAGTYLGPVLSGTSGKFSRPTDMVCLSSGEFVVKDDTKLRLFSSEGTFLSVICELRAATKCFGLTEDDQGRLVCIRRSGRDTDLVFWDVESKQIVKRMTLEDIIADKANSKCRFLTFQGGKIYITDLGLNKIYVIDAKTYTVMKVTHVLICNHMILVQAFGEAGSGPGCFDDPAGLGVDAAGNMVVADSKNHRLCVFSARGVFLGQPRLPEVRRPSGLLLDTSTKHLFVLNLSGQTALVKYKLNC
jgi:tripartite motif-containing protein 71